MIGPNERYDVRWVGRCQFDRSDKIWGWFIYNDPTVAPFDMSRTAWSAHRPSYAYTFWGPTGKTLQFKKHPYHQWELDKLVRKKKERNYNEISVPNLTSLWDNLFDTINDKFIFHLLADDI